MYRFNQKQLQDFVKHVEGIVRHLETAKRTASESNPAPCPFDMDEIDLAFEPAPTPAPQPTAFPICAPDDDNNQRHAALSHLCGKWRPGDKRCDIEIVRLEEHYVLYHLKRNGARTDERYLLIWNYGEIFYYCPESRVTTLAYVAQTDTLMLSPGVDYTRVTES